MSVKIRTKNRRLYLDIYHNGARKWEALKISLSTDKETNKEILKVAEICRAKRELQILTSAWGITDPVGGNISLYSYLEKIKAKGAPAVQNIITSSLHYLKNFPGGAVIQLKQVTTAWLIKYQEYLTTNCVKPTTASTYEAQIRHALKLAMREHLIATDPTLGIKKIKRNDPNKIFLNADELQRIALMKTKYKTVETVRRAFLFGCNTGLRISDLRSLEWGHIQYNPLQLIMKQTKTKNIVYIPLNDTAWKLINDGKIHNHADKIFPTISRWNNKTIKDICKTAGIKKIASWHTARHTFAVMSLENGVDIYTLSKLMGHTDVKTTQVYAKATDKMKREAVNALPELKVN